MRFLIPTAIAAALLIPTAAMACPNCIMHGSEREDKAWSQIIGRKNPLIPATASDSAKVSTTPSQKAPAKAKSAAPAKTTK